MNTLNNKVGTQHTNFLIPSNDKHFDLMGFVIYQTVNENDIEYIEFQNISFMDWLKGLLESIKDTNDLGKFIGQVFLHVTQFEYTPLTNELINNVIKEINNSFYELTGVICYFRTDEIQAIKLYNEFCITGSDLGGGEDYKRITDFHENSRNDFSEGLPQSLPKDLLEDLNFSQMIYLGHKLQGDFHCAISLKKEAIKEASNYLVFLPTESSLKKSGNDFLDFILANTKFSLDELVKSQLQNKLSQFNQEVA
jgi:hypothetical protein